MRTKEDVICWWSGGVTSAVACKLSIGLFEKIRIVFIDTKNEHEDTYRFKNDCEKWYGMPIETITAIGDKYKSIQDVWRKHKSLNVATGAICSYMLKRKARETWQKDNSYSYQVFGFEFGKKEMNRAISLKMNHELSRPIFPLIMMGLTKEDCIKQLQDDSIEIPLPYKFGLQNNNCMKTGCVQGGIGYWKKIKTDFPDMFDKMAAIEHELTEAKGKPITMLKDQSNEAKRTGKQLVFLKKNKDYPGLKSIDDMKSAKIAPLMDCNGFCGTNDLNKRNTTELELNFEIT